MRALLIAAALAAGWTLPASACSTCKCGDYTITLFGDEQAFSGRLRLAADALWRSERQGTPGVDALKTDEQRTTLSVGFALSPRWILAAQIPYVRKEIQSATLARQQAEGLGDVDLIARWVLQAEGEPVLRRQSGLRLGLRVPSGQQIRSADGALLDIDVQPDAGAWAPNLGVFSAWYGYPWFTTVTATAFYFGDARQGFEPGHALVASGLAQYALSQTWAVSGGLDARLSGKNRFSGEIDPNSGGLLTMAQLGLAARLSPDAVVQAAFQLPVFERLNGEQREDPVLRLSLALDL